MRYGHLPCRHRYHFFLPDETIVPYRSNITGNDDELIP
jgi:hypothetical protein